MIQKKNCFNLLLLLTHISYLNLDYYKIAENNICGLFANRSLFWSLTVDTHTKMTTKIHILTCRRKGTYFNVFFGGKKWKHRKEAERNDESPGENRKQKGARYGFVVCWTQSKVVLQHDRVLFVNIACTEPRFAHDKLWRAGITRMIPLYNSHQCHDQKVVGSLHSGKTA